MRFTTEDLKAMGFVRGEDGVARPLESVAPAEPTGTIVGIDPGLRNLGLAMLNVGERKVQTSYVSLSRNPLKGEDEAAFLTRRLGALHEKVRLWCMTAARLEVPVTVIVEGAKPLHGRQVTRESLLKLGTAVGTCLGAAVEGAVWAARWVSPGWTREVLFGAGSGPCPKQDRWARAQSILGRHEIEWPLPCPWDIQEDSPEEHRADALVLCVARLVELGVRAT